MTEKEKNLLLKDLSARLVYGVHISEYNTEYGLNDSVLSAITNDYFSDGEPSIEGCWINRIENVRPYLRPIQSMTDEDMEDYAIHEFSSDQNWEIVDFKRTGKGFINVVCRNKNNANKHWTFQIRQTSPLENYRGIDWLNAHHFDYRGLIKMGLALKAPEGMYDKKQENDE